MSPTTPLRCSAAQTTHAPLSLRGLRFDGTLPAGTRLSELVVVQRLCLSRARVRAALRRLCEEGPASAPPDGGYAVPAFSGLAAHDAIELRGTLQGLVMAQTTSAEARLILTLARDRRCAVIAALKDRRRARAEAPMRERARLAHRDLRHVLQVPATITRMRHGALIGRAHPATAGSSRPALLPGVPHA